MEERWVFIWFLHNVVCSPPILSFNAGTVHPASQLLLLHAQLLF